MEIYNKDLIIGDFRLSDYGLMLGSFSHVGESEDDIALGVSTIEEFIGDNPVPIYLGQKHSNKLIFQATFVKNPCIFGDNLRLCENDCRSVLRTLTSGNGYQWLKLVLQEPDEDLWYRAKANSISYKRINGHVAGMIVSFECDSCFAWTKENVIVVNAEAGRPFYIYVNSDDMNNYVFPTVELRPSSTGLSLVNTSDNRWKTSIKNIRQNEMITLDSRRQIVTSNTTSHESLMDDFNLGWPRLIPGKNEYVSDSNVAIVMKFRAPRKAGVLK